MTRSRSIDPSFVNGSTRRRVERGRRSVAHDRDGWYVYPLCDLTILFTHTCLLFQVCARVILLRGVSRHNPPARATHRSHAARESNHARCLVRASLRASRVLSVRSRRRRTRRSDADGFNLFERLVARRFSQHRRRRADDASDARVA